MKLRRFSAVALKIWKSITKLRSFSLTDTRVKLNLFEVFTRRHRVNLNWFEVFTCRHACKPQSFWGFHSRTRTRANIITYLNWARLRSWLISSKFSARIRRSVYHIPYYPTLSYPMPLFPIREQRTMQTCNPENLPKTLLHDVISRPVPRCCEGLVIGVLTGRSGMNIICDWLVLFDSQNLVMIYCANNTEERRYRSGFDPQDVFTFSDNILSKHQCYVSLFPENKNDLKAL